MNRHARVIAGLGFVASAMGYFFAPSAFPHAWLAALTAWLGWPLGCMALIFVHELTGGRWGEELRPQLIAGVQTLPVLMLAFVPWLWVSPQLYDWLQPDHLPNGFYLNRPFFIGRVAVYTIVWLALGLLISRGRTRLAPLGLILLAVTVSFASIDMTMSLDNHFVSSVYGLLTMAGMGLLALSICLLSAATTATTAATSAVPGKLLLGLVLLWAYLDFMQVLILWQSDLPTDAHWYAPRSSGSWGTVAAVVVAFHFVLPLIALLAPSVRRSGRTIGGVAALLIIGEWLRSWWLVLPASSSPFGLVDVTTMIGLGAIAFAWTWRRRHA
jgi:hypothetical protein